jgi:hypothetical protein
MKDRNIIVTALQLIRLNYVERHTIKLGQNSQKEKRKNMADESHFCFVFHPIPSAYGGQYNGLTYNQIGENGIIECNQIFECNQLCYIGHRQYYID